MSLMNKPIKVYKKGSRGEVCHEFKTAQEFFELESNKRHNHSGTNRNTVYASIYASLRGTQKSMRSYYLGYDVVIKIKHEA